MNVTIIKKLPSAETIIQEFPLSIGDHRVIARDRAEIEKILEGKDKRFLMIVGPCSAWPKEAVLDYAEKLKRLSGRIKDRVKVVMRVYIQKPRTLKGWTGPVNQPDPFGSPDIEAGIRYSRSMMVKIIKMGLPIADEVVFTHNAKIFQELLAWVAMGARSTEDQEHRIFISALDCPAGIKNPTHGSIEIGVNGVVAAQHHHVAVFEGHEVQTHGNPYAHLVLRGGESGTNYSAAHIRQALAHMSRHKVKNPAILIDASHDNCKVRGVKQYSFQTGVVKKVLATLRENSELKNFVKGFMLESFLKPGNQKVDPANPEKTDMGGLSITDPCLGWDETEETLLSVARFK